MVITSDDVVVIRPPEKAGDPIVITVNCPDKTGLGCDLCRIILFFGLSIVKGDVTTDGKWCYIVFWVVGKGERWRPRWNLLKKRLLGACPSYASASEIYYYGRDIEPTPPRIFLLKLCCLDRMGLLHDVTEVLCELELTIRKVKISTTPDGRVMDLFFITDTRELLHTSKRQDDTIEQLRAILGDSLLSCEIELASLGLTSCSQGSSFLPPPLIDEMFGSELPEEPVVGSPGTSRSTGLSITMDNSFCPGYTLIQILCQDHKGLLYDIMRTLKDYNIQISYGRFSASQSGNCEADLFVVQADGNKIVDSSKQKALCSRLRMELFHPLHVTVVSRGPDMELLVANPVELSGKGRPLVFYDVTFALKMLNTCIFSAEIARHVVGGREWEVYRILLDDGNECLAARKRIEEGVTKILMGWE